ncbi:MAG: hypothetical protein K2J26_02970, partial [Ruminococcus sp.]|nr:hypothetical protein [Ruminococcus sp.]
MSENSAGTISLDLVIQNNTAEQLANVQNQVKQPAQKIGESIEVSIEASMQKTAENVQKTLGSAFEKASDSANSSMRIIKRILKEAEIPSDPTERLAKGLENIASKMMKIDGQRQKILNSVDDNAEDNVKFTDNDIEKLVQLEDQLISLANTADRYRQKIDSVGSETVSTVDAQFQGIFV